MGEVVDFPGITYGELPPEYILKNIAAEDDLQNCIVIGWKDDNTLALYSSTGDSREVLWMLEKAKQFLLSALDA